MGFTKRAIGVMIQCLRKTMFIAILSFLNVFPTSLYLPLLHAQVSKDELVHVDPFPVHDSSEEFTPSLSLSDLPSSPGSYSPYAMQLFIPQLLLHIRLHILAGNMWMPLPHHYALQCPALILSI